MGYRRTWLSHCQQKKNCSRHTAGPVSQRTGAGRQGAHRKAPQLQINFPLKQAKAPTPRSWISIGSIPAAKGWAAALGFSFLCLKEATGFVLVLGQLKHPHCAFLASLHISVISKPEKVTETQEKPTSLLHWNSSFCLAHAFVAMSCMPKAGTNTEVWQGSEPWLLGWERGVLGPQPGHRALLHIHCQLLQLQSWCSSHAHPYVPGGGQHPWVLGCESCKEIHGKWVGIAGAGLGAT